MTPHDQAARLQVAIERFKGSQAKILIKLVGAVESTALSTIPAIEIKNYKMPAVARMLLLADQKASVTTLPILGEYRQNLRDFANFQNEVESEMWGATKLAGSEVAEVMETPLGVDGKDRGKSVSQYLQNWFDDSRSVLFGNIRRGAFERMSNSQIAHYIHGTKEAHYKNGAVETLRRNGTTLSNTIVQHVAMSIRMAVLPSTNATGVHWSALLEKNSCARCGGLDGTRFGLDRGPRSPLHHGCRCFMVPEFPGEVWRNEPSYFEWLKAQDRDYIESVLGVTRAAVFLDGGLSASRFADLQLDRKFEPVTLEQFKKLAPSTFKRAGV